MSNLDTTTASQLRQMVETIEGLNEEKAETGRLVSDKFREAKGLGFDVPALRECIRLRKLTQAERDEKFSVLDTYMEALGATAGASSDDDDTAEGYGLNA